MQFIACQIAWACSWYFLASAIVTAFLVAFGISGLALSLKDFWMGSLQLLHPLDASQSFVVAWLAFMLHVTIEKRAKKAIENSDEMAKANIELALARASADHQFFHDAIAKLMTAQKTADTDATSASAALATYRETSAPNEATRKKTMDEANAAWRKSLDAAITRYKPQVEMRMVIDALIVFLLALAGWFITVG